MSPPIDSRRMAHRPSDRRCTGLTCEGEEAVMLRSFLCRLNLGHDWHVETTEDGQRYRRCQRCGKYEDRGSKGPGDWAASLG